MMRRARLWAVVALVGALLTAAGCQTPVGTDGNLVDEWPALAAPGFKLPAVGTCLASSARFPFDPKPYPATPIACGDPHTLEVVLVGTVDGTAASAAEPPAWESEAYQATFASCGKAVNDYVGGDWHTGLLGIDVQMPRPTPWHGGLRSYVCTVYATSSAVGDMSTTTTGSLKGSLGGGAVKALRCMTVVGEADSDGFFTRIATIIPVDCAQPHEGEFTGVVQLTGGASMPADDVMRRTMRDHCWSSAASFLGLTLTQLSSRQDVWVAWDGMSLQHWQSGDRYQRCFVLVSTKQRVRASLKGLGKQKLPT